jgi:hypothetical protein
LQAPWASQERSPDYPPGAVSAGTVMTFEPKLGVRVVGNDIIITLLGTHYSVTYFKRKGSPGLFAKDMSLTDDPRLPLTSAEFLAKAWKVANDKCARWGGLFSARFGGPPLYLRALELFEHLKVFLEDALRSLKSGKGGFGSSHGIGIGSSCLQTLDPGNLPSDDNAPSEHVASGQFQFGFCHLAIFIWIAPSTLLSPSA